MISARVAGDSGTTGLTVNGGNRAETGRFWQMGPCADAHNHDKNQPTAPGAPDRDQLAGNLLSALMPPGATPIYGPAPHCNAMGLSPLGVHLVERMMQRKMIIDPDHLSVLARQQLLDVVAGERLRLRLGLVVGGSRFPTLCLGTGNRGLRGLGLDGLGGLVLLGGGVSRHDGSSQSVTMV